MRATRLRGADAKTPLPAVAGRGRRSGSMFCVCLQTSFPFQKQKAAFLRTEHLCSLLPRITQLWN